MIILDSDILSMFAKADALDVLQQILSGSRLCITPRIKEELTIPLQYGYSFPQVIFDHTELIFPTEEEAELNESFQMSDKSLGKGELEAIAVAKKRACIYATNDRKAIELAVREGLTIMNVHTVFKIAFKKGIYSIEEIRGIVLRLENSDNAIILDKDRIYEDAL